MDQDVELLYKRVCVDADAGPHGTGTDRATAGKAFRSDRSQHAKPTDCIAGEDDSNPGAVQEPFGESEDDRRWAETAGHLASRNAACFGDVPRGRLNARARQRYVTRKSYGDD